MADERAISILEGVSLNLGKLAQLQRIVNTLPLGAVLSTTVGTTNAQVIAADSTRTGIVFHNAGTPVPLLVAPSTDANGTALSPTFSSPQGGLVILPLDYLPLSGNVQTAWTAAAQTATANPLTIITSNY